MNLTDWQINVDFEKQLPYDDDWCMTRTLMIEGRPAVNEWITRDVINPGANEDVHQLCADSPIDLHWKPEKYRKPVSV